MAGDLSTGLASPLKSRYLFFFIIISLGTERLMVLLLLSKVFNLKSLLQHSVNRVQVSVPPLHPLLIYEDAQLKMI